MNLFRLSVEDDEDRIALGEETADGWIWSQRREHVERTFCVHPGKRGRVNSRRRRKLRLERWRPDQRRAAVPCRDSAFGRAAIGGCHHVAAIVCPGRAEWKSSDL